MNVFISKEGFLIPTDEPQAWLEESKELANKGNRQKAKELAVKALSWYQTSAAKVADENGEITCCVGEANCLWHLGVIHTQHNEWREAEREFKNAAEVYRRIDHLQDNCDNVLSEFNALEAECDVLNNLTIVYGHLGKYKESLSLCRSLMQYYKKTGNKEKQVASMKTAAMGLLSLDQDDEALDMLEQALKIAGQTGDRKLEDTVRNIIDTYYE